MSDRSASRPPSLADRTSGAIARGRSIGPGLLVCATIAMASTFVSDHYGGPVMLYALLLGMAFHFLATNPAITGGLTFSAKFVLRLGVALLGARITVDQILSLGALPILLVVGGVSATLLFGQAAARVLGLHREFGALSAVAVSICGVSAALTAASVLPKRQGSERDTIFVALAVTTLSTVAMVLYPLLVTLFGLDAVQGGVFLGGTIHDVAQVVGAGYMMGDETGDVATFTKLLRVAMLVPVALALSLVVRRWLAAEPDRAEGPAQRPPVGLPWFLVAFVAVVAVNSFGLLPPSAAVAMTDVSRACLVVAIAAIGVRTSFQELAAVGWRPAALLVAETVFLAGLVLGALVALR